MAEAATGRTDDAMGRLETAIADNTRWGARPWVAQTELDLAGTLLERKADGDRERAERLAERARATAAELGLAFVGARAEPLAERARAGS